MRSLFRSGLRYLFHDRSILRPGLSTVGRFSRSFAQFPLSSERSSGFGFTFDIDGVISRGRSLLPQSVDAFRHLTDDDGRFLVPSIFMTNASHALPHSKAEQLSEWLGVKVDPSQVVMAHSPLKMFRQFHDKHFLVCGQGPTEVIAKHLGFTKVTTMEQLQNSFPLLDAVEYGRKRAAPCAFEKYFPKIDGILLLNEPVRWELGCQLLLDVLLSNGHPWNIPDSLPYPHIPVLACNMDLVWMSEAPLPRIGHGCFLQCLETLYRRMTGCELQYTAVLGKPSEISYHYAERILQRQAKDMGLPCIQRMYCIGDNPEVDIYGANLFSRRLQRNSNRTDTANRKSIDFDQELLLKSVKADQIGISSCESVLVGTGVYDLSRNDSHLVVAKSRGDFIMDSSMCVPTVSTVHNVLEAVTAVLKRELQLEKQRR